MKTLTQTTEAITDGQKKLITRMIGDAADSDPVQEALSVLSKKGAERLKGNPEFVATIRQVIVEKISEFGIADEYANEEVVSKYGYLSGYKPVDLQTQKAILTEAFPELKGFFPGLLTQIVEGKIKLPANAEGWFAIPNWKKNPKIFGSTYSEAVLKVLEVIKKTRDGAFYNYRDGEVDEQHLRQTGRSEQFWDELAKAQGDADILIIAGQFGIRHRGRSVRRARVVMEDAQGEVGLGAFAVGIMILSHPIRLKHYDDLWIDCAGDEFSPGGVGAFSKAPCFWFYDGKVWFGTEGVGGADGRYGSASGFSPQ